MHTLEVELPDQTASKLREAAEKLAITPESLTVRVVGLGTLRGTYRLEAAGKAAATAQDKQRIAAESLMIESDKLFPQGGKAAPKIIENMQQALAIWREQNEPSWEAWSLQRIGFAHSDLSQQEKAIEYLGQGLSLYQAA